jgi:hypothetical protein
MQKAEIVAYIQRYAATFQLPIHEGVSVCKVQREEEQLFSIATSAGEYTANQGVLDAVNRLSLVVSGEPDPGPPEVKVVEVESNFKSAEETDVQGSSVLVIVLLLAATIIPMATYYWYQRG